MNCNDSPVAGFATLRNMKVMAHILYSTKSTYYGFPALYNIVLSLYNRRSRLNLKNLLINDFNKTRK